TEAGHNLVGGHGRHPRALVLEKLLQLLGTLEGRPEFVVVLRTHARHPVQTLGWIRGDARDRGRGDDPLREECRAGQRMRPPARPAHRVAAGRAEVVEHGGDVARDVRDAATRTACRSRIPGAGIVDETQAALSREIDEGGVWKPGARRAVVMDEGSAVLWSADVDLQGPAVRHRQVDRVVLVHETTMP